MSHTRGKCNNTILLFILITCKFGKSYFQKNITSVNILFQYYFCTNIVTLICVYLQFEFFPFLTILKKKSGLLLEIFQKYIEDIEKIKNLLSKYLYIIIKLLLEDFFYRKDYNNQDF